MSADSLVVSGCPTLVHHAEVDVAFVCGAFVVKKTNVTARTAATPKRAIATFVRRLRACSGPEASSTCGCLGWESEAVCSVHRSPSQYLTRSGLTGSANHAAAAVGSEW